MKQTLFEGSASYRHLPEILSERNCTRPLVICGKHSYSVLPVSGFLADTFPEAVLFRDFTPNPEITEVLHALGVFQTSGADCLIAVGGGSAIDIAKAVRYRLEQRVPLIAMPSTAGTGSEATQFAVVYENGVKQSLDDPSLLPDVCILDPDVLEHLPAYTRTCAMADTLCQAVESWWSVHATEESIGFSKEALSLLMPVAEDYLNKKPETYAVVMKAAHLAGKAIQITRTTAPHAMSYKLTSLYGIAHGHAVFLLLPRVWKHMLASIEGGTAVFAEGFCKDRLAGTFSDIAQTLFSCNAPTAVEKLLALGRAWGLTTPEKMCEADLPLLAGSVNAARLSNHPVILSPDELSRIYRSLL